MTAFTDKFVAALKAEGARLELKDDGCRGLSIRVTTGGKGGGVGRKTWCYRFKRDGCMRRLTLGEYPVMTLGEARIAANRRTEDLHDGRNPVAEAQREELAAAPSAADELTYDRLADRFMEEYSKPRKRTWKDDEWLLKRVRAEFGLRMVSTVRRGELVKFLRRLAVTSVYNANRTQGLICKMLNWINLEEESIVNPLARIPKIGGKEREEDRVLTDEELKLLWPAFVDSDALAAATGIALRLIFLTAQRPKQIAGMRVDELVGLDGTAPRWDLPAARMKRPKPHSVPLTPEAIQQIKQALAQRVQEDSPFVFPSPRGGGRKSIQSHALSTAARRLRTKLKMAEWSPHDGRRSATTWARSMGIPRDTTEALTHHAIVGSGKTYDRYDMLAEKREAVEAIAKYINRITKSAKVVADLAAA
jgi:integrase